MTGSPYQSLAEIYDAIRPGYPDALIEDILTAAAPTVQRPLLEIGAGTGKATEQFLFRSCWVDAVELEPEMAALLKKRLNTPHLRLSVGSFERWIPPCSSYQLICCAQAFHWIDPAVKYQKCHDLLEPKGILALFWYDPQPPEDSPAQQAAEAVRTRWFGPAAPLSAGTAADRARELREAEGFALTLEKQYRVCLRNTPEQALLAMESTPAFAEQMRRLLPEEQAAFAQEYTAAIMEHGGVLEASMLYSLYLLERR